MRFDNFPHINKKLYYFGFSAKVFTYVVVGLVILLVILFTISKFLIIGFAPIALVTYLIGNYFKRQHSKGNRDFFNSYLNFRKIPVLLNNRSQSFSLMKNSNSKK